jgi:hypothetical protein
MNRLLLLAALALPLSALAQEEEAPVIVGPSSDSHMDAGAKSGISGHHLITKDENKEAIKADKARQKADAEAQAKADAAAKARAEAEAKAKAEADAKARADAEETRQKDEAARLAAEQKKVDAELKKQQDLEKRKADLDKRKAELDEKKKKLEESKKTLADKKKAAAEEKKLEAEAKKIEQEEAKQAGKLAANQKKVEDEAAKADAAAPHSRRVLVPGQATAYVEPTADNPKPAHTAEEALADPRFHAGSVVEDAQVKIASVAPSFAFLSIPNSGCSAGKAYVTGALLAAFDGMSAGSNVVLKIDDPSLGPAKAGSSLAFSSLRRAGKAEDGTFVYCGKGTAFPVRR